MSFSLSSACVRLQDVHMNTKSIDVVTLLYCISEWVCVSALTRRINKNLRASVVVRTLRVLHSDGEDVRESVDTFGKLGRFC